MNKLRHKRLRDRLFHSYVSWREACHHVSEAYRSWDTERGPGAAASFALKRADRLLSNTDCPHKRLDAAAKEVGSR